MFPPESLLYFLTVNFGTLQCDGLCETIKKKGKLWIRVFPDKAITKHPAETRMGKGKGAPDHWVAVIKPGTILFELEGATLEDTQKAMRLASDKLPIKTKLVARR